MSRKSLWNGARVSALHLVCNNNNNNSRMIQRNIWQYFNYFICRDFLIGFQRTSRNSYKRKQIYCSQFMRQNCQLLLLSRHSSSFFVCPFRGGNAVFVCHLSLLRLSLYCLPSSMWFHFCCYYYYSIVEFKVFSSFPTQVKTVIRNYFCQQI